MKTNLTFLLFAVAGAAFAQSPSVSNISFDGVSHSVVRVNFTASAQFFWMRTRFAISPATCTGGTGGMIQASSYSNFNFGALHSGPGNTVVLGGLTPNTTYQICPEISADFTNWSTGAGATMTTLPLGVDHPSNPIAPTSFKTDYPNTTGYSNVTVASDCSDLMSQISTALQNQPTNGSVIQIPAGAVCNGPFTLSQRSPDVTVLPSSAVNTSTNAITVSNHGFTEGQGIIFGTSYGCLPGSLTNLNGGDCHKFGPIIPGQLYYVHVLDANTLQVYNGAPMSSGGTLIVLPDGGNGTELFVHWPRPLKWIVIRTATPDQNFTPEHVRTNPAWAPKMAVLQSPTSTLSSSVANKALVTLGDFDGNNDSMIANIRFVGVEFTYAANPSAATSIDPNPWYSLFTALPTDQNIIVDRCYFHGLGTPNRVFNALRWDGLNVAIVDSYLDNMEYFHSMYSGLALTKVN